MIINASFFEHDKRHVHKGQRMKTGMFLFILSLFACNGTQTSSNPKVAGWEPGTEISEINARFSVAAARSVVLLGVKDESGSLNIACSGTYIGEKRVLTASHCPDILNRWLEQDMSSGTKSYPVVIFNSLSFNENVPAGPTVTDPIKVVKMVKHPDYKLMNIAGVDDHTAGSTRDISMFFLESNTDESWYRPMKVFQGTKEDLLAYMALQQADFPIQMIGGGKGYRYSSEKEAKENTDNLPHAGRISGLLTNRGKLTGKWFRTDESSVIDGELFELAPMDKTFVAPGDSGGPALIIDNQGEAVLIGVAAFVSDKPDGSGPDYANQRAYYEFIGAYKSWLSSVVSD